MYLTLDALDYIYALHRAGRSAQGRLFQKSSDKKQSQQVYSTLAPASRMVQLRRRREDLQRNLQVLVQCNHKFFALLTA